MFCVIITELYGGLGNQMFQYAVARSLAIKNNSDLKLDLSIFDAYKLRVYELGHFNIQEKFSNQSDIRAFDRRRRWRRILGKLQNKFRSDELKLIKEKQFCFDQDIINLKGNLYLRGYWQTEKYFKDIENVIRKDFSLKNKISDASSEVAMQINAQKCPVSLHIRRGDYISDSGTNEYHGTCSLEYYKKCVNILKGKYDISLYVFSDDPLWVKENLHFDCPATYISHNGAERAYEDMYLMSLCHHHIIANSSFSWWGAWLNPRKDKMVFAPKVWFRNKTNDTKDLLPDSWIRL